VEKEGRARSAMHPDRCVPLVESFRQTVLVTIRLPVIWLGSVESTIEFTVYG